MIPPLLQRILCLSAWLVLAAGCAGPPEPGPSPIELLLAGEVPPRTHSLAIYGGDWPNTLYIRHNEWDGSLFEITPYMDIYIEVPDPEAVRDQVGRGWITENWQWTQSEFTTATLPADHASSPTLAGDLPTTYSGRKRIGFRIPAEVARYFDLHGEVRVVGNRVIMESQITNLCDADWSKGSAFVSLRTRNTTEFHDETGANIFVFPLDGSPKQSVAHYKSISFDRNVPGGEYFNFWTRVRRQDGFLPQMLKVNNDGTRSIFMSSYPGINITGNLRWGINTTDVNYLLECKPGQTINCFTSIEFREHDAGTTLTAGTPVLELINRGF